MYTDFEFDGLRLSDFDCIMCHVNSTSGMREVEIGCDITFQTVKNNHTSIHSATSSSYDNVYTTPFEIMKNPCNKQSESIYFTEQEIRRLIKWLNRREYCKFRFCNPDFTTCYYGSFNVKEILLNDQIIGLSLVFTSNAPYGFDEEAVFEYSVEKNDEIVIAGDGDEYGTIYPRVKITCLANGDLTMTNPDTGLVVSIKNCLENETIYLDGEHKIIYSDSETHEETLGQDFNYEYLAIEVDADTTYEISLPCEIVVSYSPIRKVGVR